MANKPKSQERNRRAQVEAMRREQQARERRKSLLFIVIAVVVGLGLVAAAAVPAYLDSRNDPANKAVDTFGVAASAAECDDVLTEDPEPAEHVDEGTDLDYEAIPPASGSHWSAPAFPARNFYTDRDRPTTEQLVHNLEHGYTILWYDDALADAQKDVLRELSAAAAASEPAGPGNKFIAVPWEDAEGDLPEGKQVALSHWSATKDQRQFCGKVSGEAVQAFLQQFPYSDSPEPDAQ